VSRDWSSDVCSSDLVDLARTFCEIADLPVPDWMQGETLPTRAGEGRRTAIVEWDSQLDTGYAMRTLVADGWICTAYEPTATDYGFPRERRYADFGIPPERVPDRIIYDGTEGELYDTATDPHQWHNLWDDPAHRERRDAMVAELRERLPEARTPRLQPAAMG